MHHRIPKILSVSAALALAVAFMMQLNSTTRAQRPTEWMKCLGLDSPIINNVIDGCTAVIQLGREPREKLATAFDNRGVAYKQKGQFERASAHHLKRKFGCMSKLTVLR